MHRWSVCISERTFICSHLQLHMHQVLIADITQVSSLPTSGLFGTAFPTNNLLVKGPGICCAVSPHTDNVSSAVM